MKRLTFIAVLILHGIISVAQSVSGKITDSESAPIEFANIVLINAVDSVFVGGTVSDVRGCFTLQLPGNAEKYMLKVSRVGYETVFCKVQIRQPQNIVMPAAALLGEVTVKGGMPMVDLTAEGLTINVRKSMLRHAGTAEKLMMQLPGVNYYNGIFNVFGKGEAKVYVDGRELMDLSTLDNINSADIQTVQTIMNPGVKYGTDVNAVIAITTTKRKERWTTDIRSVYGRSDRNTFIEQVNLNHHSDKSDLFGTFVYADKPQNRKSGMEQKVYTDILWTQGNKMEETYRNRSYRATAGFNYTPSKRHSFGIQYSLTMYPEFGKSMTMSSDIFKDGSFYGSYETVGNESGNRKPMHLVNLYYSVMFGKLNVDLMRTF